MIPQLFRELACQAVGHRTVRFMTSIRSALRGKTRLGCGRCGDTLDDVGRSRPMSALVCRAVGHRTVRHVASTGGGPTDGETWTTCVRCMQTWGP